MRFLVIFLLAAVGTFIIDQSIKDLFVAGYGSQGKCISLELHYNKGVAFSMLAFLGGYLKWFQALLILVAGGYLFYSNLVKRYPLAFGLLAGGALGNLYDRFTREGVVDYIYWHCWFNYPVFNYADIMVSVVMLWLLIKSFLLKENR